MKLTKAKISIMINSDYTEITIEDEVSNTNFVRVRLTPAQLSQCLSRLAYVSCECEVLGLERLGKKHQNESFEFEIPENISSKDEKILIEMCNKELAKNEMHEWIPDRYFGSQGSFFNKEGKRFARATIRRWIDL